MGKRGKSKQPSPEPDSMGLDMLNNDWAADAGAARGWGEPTIPEEDEEEEEEDEEEEEYASYAKRGGNRGGQQQHPKGGSQQQRQKGNKGNHNQIGTLRNQQNEKSQKNQKGKKQQQQETAWGSGGGGGAWVNDAPATNDLAAATAVGWGDVAGGERQPQHSKSNPLGSSARQQRLLASLLNQPWTPSGTERGRGINQQGYGQGRTPSATAVDGQTPSRTLLYAATGTTTASVLDGGARSGPHTTVQIHDSGGAALQDASRALYSRERLASQRIHWMFSPTKDDRVASLLDWVQAMSHALATLGLHKFIRTEQRGALMANADFRPWKAPNEPAFDWVTFEDVVETYDRTLQESMAFYDPESQVLVFVFLLSRSGNSLAMWRRKIAVPSVVRKQNRSEIARITRILAERKYVITVDDLPPPPVKPKKNWFNVRW